MRRKTRLLIEDRIAELQDYQQRHKMRARTERLMARECRDEIEKLKAKLRG